MCVSDPDPSAEPEAESQAANLKFHLVSSRSNTSHSELLTCALKPAPPQVFSISEKGSSFPPIAQVKNLGIILSFFYTLIQSTGRSHELYFWSYSEPLLPTSTATVLA